MKRNKRFAALLLCIALMSCLMTGCEWAFEDNNEETSYTEEIKSQIGDMYGYPDVSNFFEYSQLKEIYEMRDDPNLICYWYTKNGITGKWIYQGPCIGYGIPYSASITAPESPQNKYANGSHYTVLPLAEPNGIYTDGLTTSATWILAEDSKGNIKPIYVESEITVSQTKMDARLCEEWSLPSGY